MKTKQRQIGDEGEEIATSYLSEQGYKIIDRNVSNPFGEIDLIAQKEQHLFFVEIKRRRGQPDFGSAIDAVSPQKIKKLWRAVECELGQRSEWTDLIPFISLIALDDQDDGTVAIEFIPDAVAH